jgi:hypothetical protein
LINNVGLLVHFVFLTFVSSCWYTFFIFLSPFAEPLHFQQPHSFLIVRPSASTLHYRV